MFHIATPEEIKEGKVTDVYFARTLEILKKKGIDKKVVAEVWAKSLPNHWSWAVLAGVEECVSLLKGLKIKVSSLPEGTIFQAFAPVLTIEGYYTEFALFETAILGFLCQASGVATTAARCRKAAGDKPLLSFGARRMHPAISPMIDRSAFIGGCDGVSVIKNAEFIGVEPVGTMPHALILMLGDTVEATLAFDQIMDKNIKRVALIDTFQDEKFEALRVAEALGKKLAGVRLDTPSSRRGDFLQILKEIRWELDIRGFNWVKLYVSGGIDEKKILELNPYADAFGVGTYITSAPVVDFSLDLVEIEGKPLAKRGKLSGKKKLWRCPGCFNSLISYGEEIPKSECNCGENLLLLTQPLIEDHKIVRKLPSPQEIKRWVLEQLSQVEL